MSHPDASLEYQQLNESIRALADVRFKLLAFFPVLGAIAGYALALLGFDPAAAQPSIPVAKLPFILAAASLGFLISLGVTLYDQRNSELYNALIHRAKYLEQQWAQPATPGALKDAGGGGQYSERPAPQRRLLLRAKHDTALALIYGCVLGAWWFPILCAVIGLAEHAKRGAPAVDGTGVTLALLLSAVVTFLFISALLALDARDRTAYHRAAVRDRLG